MLHSSKECIGVCTNRNIKDGMGESVEIRSYTVKQYKKPENKYRKELKYIKK